MIRRILCPSCLLLIFQFFQICSDTKAAPSENLDKSKVVESKKSPEASAVLVVLVYDQDCHVTCTRVRPMLQKLTKSYGSKVRFAELNTGKMSESKKMATSLGISKFFSESTDQAPIVGFFDAKGKKIKKLEGFKEESVFRTAIDQALQARS